MSANRVLRLPVFISSPSDLQLERQIARDVINDLNQNPLINENYLLVPLLYEELVPPVMGDVAQMIVERYTVPPADCYLVICMFWNRMGTPFEYQGKRYPSGTYYEFKCAYDAVQADGKPNLLLYRKQPSEAADTSQQALVERFFNQVGQKQTLKGLYKTFAETDMFKNLLKENILQVLAHDFPVGKGQPSADLYAEVNVKQATRSTIISGVVNSNIHILSSGEGNDL